MQEILLSLSGKPRLLLHSCCAPCSSSCLELLEKYFDITVYYYNPNIDTEEEYERRKSEQLRLPAEMSIAVNTVAEPYDAKAFYERVKGYESLPEGGARCRECIRLRMEGAAGYAARNGFDFFTTTLSVSPLKDAAFINSEGEALAKKYNVSFLFSDFKKKNGFLRSTQLSKQYKLYRQSYCGCVYSKK